MKTPLKSTLATLSLAIASIFAVSGCESTGGGSGTGTHLMAHPKAPYAMADRSMPGPRNVGDSADRSIPAGSMPGRMKP